MRPSATARARDKGPTGRLVLTVLVPFALGYFLSYLFRSVNAVVGPRLVAEIGRTAAELGRVTSA